MTHRHGYYGTAWLWWLAFFILIIGGGISYALAQQRPDPDARTAMSISIAITTIGAGLCVICATANWWLKR